MSTGQPRPPGGARPPPPGPRPAGDLDPSSPVDITVVLRRGRPLPEPGSGPLPRDRTAAVLGADPADVAAVRQALEAEGAEVTGVDVASRRLTVRGDVGTLQRVFGTTLARVESADPVTGRPVAHRQRTGALSLPAALEGPVVAVLGLDDRPQARARFRPAAEATTAYTPIELGRVYRFPAGTDGSGGALAVLRLGGGGTHAAPGAPRPGNGPT